MAELLRPHAERHPERPAIIDEHGPMGWARLNERVNRCVDALRRRGVAERDTIVVMGGNRRQTYEVYLAAMHAGWIVVPVNWHWVADELAYVIDDCDAAAVIVDGAWSDVAATALGATTRVSLAIGGEPPEGFESYEDALAGASPGEPDDQSMGGPMFYTSGTTGFPKGVRSALSTTEGDTGTWSLIAAGFGDMMKMPETGSVQLVCGPNYHSAQWIFGMVALLRGGTIVLQHRFDAAGALELIDTHRVTGVHLVPAQFRRFLDLPEPTRRAFDGSSLIGVFHGAAPCPADLKRRMIDWWGPVVHEYYGGTEGGFLSMISAAEWLERPGSVGRILPTVEVVAIDETGARLGPGEVGELAFRSLIGNDFAYHNAPEKTADAHRGDGFGTLGDVGYLDHEGYLYLTDRTIDMVISGGVNIYPAEIEAVLADHPRVGDVAVIGIPDEAMGEALLAIVEPAGDATTGDDLADELTTFARGRLAGYKVPRRWRFVDSLDRSPVGKLDKNHLRRVHGTD